jgi:hypothetical protein
MTDSVNIHFERKRQELADAARESVADELYHAIMANNVGDKSSKCWCALGFDGVAHRSYCLMARKAVDRYEREKEGKL